MGGCDYREGACVICSHCTMAKRRGGSSANLPGSAENETALIGDELVSPVFDTAHDFEVQDDKSDGDASSSISPKEGDDFIPLNARSNDRTGDYPSVENSRRRKYTGNIGDGSDIVVDNEGDIGEEGAERNF